MRRSFQTVSPRTPLNKGMKKGRGCSTSRPYEFALGGANL